MIFSKRTSGRRSWGTAERVIVSVNAVTCEADVPKAKIEG
jgi:hypothetical protein